MIPPQWQERFLEVMPDFSGVIMDATDFFVSFIHRDTCSRCGSGIIRCSAAGLFFYSNSRRFAALRQNTQVEIHDLHTMEDGFKNISDALQNEFVLQSEKLQFLNILYRNLLFKNAGFQVVLSRKPHKWLMTVFLNSN